MAETELGSGAEIPPRAVTEAGSVDANDATAGIVSSDIVGDGAFELAPLKCDKVGSYTEFILKGDGVKALLEL